MNYDAKLVIFNLILRIQSKSRSIINWGNLCWNIISAVVINLDSLTLFELASEP